MNRRNVRKGARLFERFNEFPASRVDTITIRDQDAELVLIGEITSIGYLARDGKEYEHRFRKSSAPKLAVSADGRQLYLIKGRYRFTGRGIVDQ